MIEVRQNLSVIPLNTMNSAYLLTFRMDHKANINFAS